MSGNAVMGRNSNVHRNALCEVIFTYRCYSKDERFSFLTGDLMNGIGVIHSSHWLEGVTR